MLNQFKLVKQANALIKHRGNNIKENDLFLIQIGGNDIGELISEIEILKQTNKNKKVIDLCITNYLNNSVANIETTICNLIAKGARKIIITNCVDVSKSSDCLKLAAQENKFVFDLVRKYNTIWAKKINNLQLKFPNLIKQYDIFHTCNKLIKQMKTKGMIVEVSASCLDFNSIFEKMFIGNKNLKFNDYTDPKINNYFFIDNSHPTKEIHRLVAEEIFKLAWNW